MDIDRLRQILEQDNDVLSTIQTEFGCSLQEVIWSNPPALTSGLILPQICLSKDPSLFSLVLSGIFDSDASRHDAWRPQEKDEVFIAWLREVIGACVFQNQPHKLLHVLSSPYFEDFKNQATVSWALQSCAKYHFHDCLKVLIGHADVKPTSDDLISLALGGKSGSPSVLKKDFSGLLPTITIALNMLPLSSASSSIFEHPLYLISSPEYPLDIQKSVGEILVERGWSMSDEVIHPLGEGAGSTDLSARISIRSSQLYEHLHNHQRLLMASMSQKNALLSAMEELANPSQEGAKRKI